MNAVSNAAEQTPCGTAIATPRAPTSMTTTLYELMAALQSVGEPDEDELIVALVAFVMSRANESAALLADRDRFLAAGSPISSNAAAAAASRSVPEPPRARRNSRRPLPRRQHRSRFQ